MGKVILVALVLFAVAALLAYWQYTLAQRTNRKRNPPALSPGGQDLGRITLDMARLLDRGLADPVIRQSDGWTEQARVLLRDYYGEN